MARERTAALIVIGNEILSGKVVDTNSAFLAAELRALGVSLRRVLVVPDELDEIATAVRAYQPLFDVVFTSGGVGPTHDDITIAGVARGLARSVERHPYLLDKLREYFADDLNDSRLKLAEVVSGTDLIFDGHLAYPTLQVDNIYILPGIPEIFRQQFAAIRQRFSADPFFLRAVYTRVPETSIAASLNRTLDAFPDLLLGSYPKLHDPEYRVRVTLESKDREYLERAFNLLLELLPPEAVVRTE